MKTERQISLAAAEFAERWKGRGYERGESKILPEIADYYHVEVSFQNEDVRQLRFYFIWKQEDSLQEVIEKLNMFEQVNLTIENGKLIAR